MNVNTDSECIQILRLSTAERNVVCHTWTAEQLNNFLCQQHDFPVWKQRIFIKIKVHEIIQMNNLEEEMRLYHFKVHVRMQHFIYITDRSGKMQLK